MDAVLWEGQTGSFSDNINDLSEKSLQVSVGEPYACGLEGYVRATTRQHEREFHYINQIMSSEVNPGKAERVEYRLFIGEVDVSASFSCCGLAFPTNANPKSAAHKIHPQVIQRISGNLHFSINRSAIEEDSLRSDIKVYNGWRPGTQRSKKNVVPPVWLIFRSLNGAETLGVRVNIYNALEKKHSPSPPPRLVTFGTPALGEGSLHSSPSRKNEYTSDESSSEEDGRTPAKKRRMEGSCGSDLSSIPYTSRGSMDSVLEETSFLNEYMEEHIDTSKKFRTNEYTYDNLAMPYTSGGSMDSVIEENSFLEDLWEGHPDMNVYNCDWDLDFLRNDVDVLVPNEITKKNSVSSSKSKSRKPSLINDGSYEAIQEGIIEIMVKHFESKMRMNEDPVLRHSTRQLTNWIGSANLSKQVQTVNVGGTDINVYKKTVDDEEYGCRMELDLAWKGEGKALDVSMLKSVEDAAVVKFDCTIDETICQADALIGVVGHLKATIGEGCTLEAIIEGSTIFRLSAPATKVREFMQKPCWEESLVSAHEGMSSTMKLRGVRCPVDVTAKSVAGVTSVLEKAEAELSKKMGVNDEVDVKWSEMDPKPLQHFGEINKSGYEESDHEDLSLSTDVSMSTAENCGDCGVIAEFLQEVNGRRLVDAVADGDRDRVMELLQCPWSSPKAHFGVSEVLCQTDRAGRTALEVAVMKVATACTETSLSIFLEVARAGASGKALAKDDVNAALVEAELFGSEECVAMLLDLGADPNVENREGKSLVYDSMARGLREVAECLLEYGADINMIDSNGDTLLHRAARFGEINVLEWALKHGANTQKTTCGGESALHVAADTAKETTLNLLVEAGADVELMTDRAETAADRARRGNHQRTERMLRGVMSPQVYKRQLFAAISVGNVDVVKMLIQEGVASVPLHHLLADVNENGVTAMGLAIRVAREKHGRDIVNVLLKAGADCSVVCRMELSRALLNAVIDSDRRLVKVLLKCGASPETKSNQEGGTGMSPLKSALLLGRESIVTLFAERTNANMACIDELSSGLHYAAHGGSVKIVDYVLRSGVNVNMKNYRGQTPLHIAAEKGHIDVVGVLMGAGADPSIRDSRGCLATELMPKV